MSSTTTHPPADPRRALGAALQRWAAAGREPGAAAAGVVRVLDRHGFGSVESGQILAAGPSGEVHGVLYLGALDDVARSLAAEAATGVAAVREAHAGEESALGAGLACAGGATLLGHPLPAGPAGALGAALEADRPAALLSRADGGAGALVLTGPGLADEHGGLGAVTAAAAEQARGILRRGATVTERISVDGTDLLVDVWVPVPSMLVVGTGALGDALHRQAGLLGWAARTVTSVAEAQAAVAAFGDADVLVLLDHDPAFDAVLRAGLAHGRGFLGALGSRRTQAARRERLLAAGVTADALAALHGPVGLDLGARTPAETAVSVVAEVIALRAGRSAQALAGSGGRIGG